MAPILLCLMDQFAYSYAPPDVRTLTLENSIKMSKTIFIGHLIRKFNREEKFLHKGMGVYYTTAGLQFEVKKILLGAIPENKVVQVVYLKQMEKGKHKFVVGQDYLLVMEDETPDFLNIKPWGQPDSVYMIKNGYSDQAVDLDLVSVFWAALAERRISKNELEDLIKMRVNDLRIRN